LKTVLLTVPKPIARRWRILIVRRGSSSSWPVCSLTWRSICPTSSSASSSRPWMKSQRGDSGT
jgi:hypothetical protein